MTPEDVAALQRALQHVADQLVRPPSPLQRRDIEQMLSRLTAAAVEVVPAVDYAGLTLRDRDGVVTSAAPTAPVVAELDRLQSSWAEGPCVDVVTPGTASEVDVEDFGWEGRRWPRFAPAAQERGIRSLTSFALAPHDAPVAALNLYARRPGTFEEIDRQVGRAFATQAAIAVYGIERVRNLTRALESRDLIGQAKGILMQRRSIGSEQAFELLVRASQRTNVKVVDVAQWIVDDAARGPAGPTISSDVLEPDGRSNAG